MKGFIRLLLIVAMVGLFTNCSSAPTGEDGVPMEGEAPAEGYAQEGDAGVDGAPQEAPPEDAGAPQEFAEGGDQSQQFAEGGEQPPADTPPAEGAPAGEDFAAQGGVQEQPPPDAGAVPPPPEASVAQQEEFNPPPPESDQFANNPPPMDQQPPMDQGAMPPPADLPPMDAPPPMVDLGPPPSENLAPAPLPPSSPEIGGGTTAALAPPEPSIPEAPASSGATASARITDIKYRANSNGGTIVVESNSPVQYTTRVNEENHQFILEIPDAALPKKLQRPFNTKDFAGAIGAIDAYQAKGSTTARIVVQIRDGFPMPKVEQEAMSIMVIAQAKGAAGEGAESAEASTSSDEEEATPEQEFADAKILPGKNLDEFISGNTQFFGKKISVEVTDMDLRDVLRLITEETGINMVLDDEVKGLISLKLKQVPWDQALVVIMKAKKLGYTRQGNVLRIAPIRDLRTEEEEATRVASSRKTQEPLRVKMIPVSYAKIDEIAKQVQQFLGDKGKVVGDSRTSALVITDIEENINKAAKLVESLDVPPYQVLIEGKIVEARDSFTRTIGVNWGASGKSVNLAGSGAKAITLNQSMSGTPTSLGSGAFNLNLSIGTLDILGDLSATLALKEREEAVKVISSPRIVTLHNEVAEINQSTEIPLISTVSANGATTTSVSFKPVRLKLNVTPQITTEGGVIMSVDVAREFVGAVVDEQSQAAPVNARSAKTKVLVHNGQTAVIGGIYQSDATESETGVPWLRHIPVLGNFFKGSNKSKDKSELLIFLTPRILGQIGSGMPKGGSGEM